MSALSLHHVGAAIDGHWLIRDATVALRTGCVTAFLGPNGSGKTTLLRVLAGLLAPSEGHVTLHGHDLQSFVWRALAQRITFVPQDTHVSVAFTVVRLSRWAVIRTCGFERLHQRDHAIVEDALRRADVWHLATRPVLALYAQISSGTDPLGSLITLSLSESEFNLTRARQYEIGLNSAVSRRPREATLAAYYIVKERSAHHGPHQSG